MNKDIFEFYFPCPSTFGSIFPLKAPCNGGKPTPPPPPPPSPAPYRSDNSQGEQALVINNRRKGLRKTILAQQLMNEKQNLGVSNNLTEKSNTVLGGNM